VLILLVIGASPVARATDGDLYARGTRYCTSTYSPGHDTPKRFGPPLDINAAGGDRGRPVLAPTDGTVEVFSRAGIYGLSVVWTSADGQEAIHVAHLERIVRRGEVRAGHVIGRAGSSGHSFGEGHLHVARQMGGRPAAMELSGQGLRPFACYASRGPIRQECLGSAATVVGTPGKDHLTGTVGHDVIVARGGDDVVDGRGGDDVVCAGSGTDRANGGSGSDQLSGGPGDDRLAGADGDDLLIGDEGNDDLDGGPGTDACDGERATGCEPPPAPGLAGRAALG
jgi:hypothetical protein